MSRDASSGSIGAPNGLSLTEDVRSLAGVPDGFGRFWALYRMVYIRGEGKPADASDVGCSFHTTPGKGDQAGLVVYCGDSCFVSTDLFPYSFGRLFVCPYRYVSDYTELTDEERMELDNLTATAMRVTREAVSLTGFNLGMNQDEVVGAGIAAHLHQHVVPHRLGDANFLSIIAQTRAVPELLEDARARLATAWLEKD